MPIATMAVGLGLFFLGAASAIFDEREEDRKIGRWVLVAGFLVLAVLFHSCSQDSVWLPERELTVVKDGDKYVAVNRKKTIDIKERLGLVWREVWTLKIVEQKSGWYGLVFWDQELLPSRYLVYEGNSIVYER